MFFFFLFNSFLLMAIKSSKIPNPKKHEKIKHFIQERKVNINYTEDKRKCTLLYDCCYYSSEVDILELLLSLGANPNICNNMGESPLMHACNRYL